MHTPAVKLTSQRNQKMKSAKVHSKKEGSTQ